MEDFFTPPATKKITPSIPELPSNDAITPKRITIEFKIDTAIENISQKEQEQPGSPVSR